MVDERKLSLLLQHLPSPQIRSRCPNTTFLEKKNTNSGPPLLANTQQLRAHLSLSRAMKRGSRHLFSLRSRRKPRAGAHAGLRLSSSPQPLALVSLCSPRCRRGRGGLQGASPGAAVATTAVHVQATRPDCPKPL